MKFLFSVVLGLSLLSVNLQAVQKDIFDQTRINPQANDASCSCFNNRCKERFDYKPAYISSYSSDTNQSLTSETSTFTPIIFTNNHPTPVNIVHPVGSDSTLFKVCLSGVYQIEWSLYLGQDDSKDIVDLQLFNVTTGLPYAPLARINVLISDSITAGVNASGTLIIQLPAETVLRLEAKSEDADREDPTFILSPTLNINRIAK